MSLILSEEFINKYKDTKPPMTNLGEFVYYRTYSRFIPELNRREYWYETCKRAVEYNCNLVDGVKMDEAEQLFDAMFNLKMFLSGRTLWVGGTESSKKYPSSNFNCCYTNIEKIEDICEVFYLLMLGCGVGFSALKEQCDKLPMFNCDIEVNHKEYIYFEHYSHEAHTSLNIVNNEYEIVVGDSKEGWVDALRSILQLSTANNIAYSHINKININYNNVRPEGSPLKTFGGYASGPEPLKQMFDKIINVIKKSGGKLKPVDILDICNLLGQAVQVGGVRRCLPQGTKVHTKNGLVNIENVMVGDLVATSNGYEKVLNIFKQGLQNVLTINTEIGDFKCTPNHRMAVINNIDGSYIWKQAKDLLLSDKLVFVENEIEGKENDLPQFSYERPKRSTTCKDITIPKLDSDVAYMLGYLHGDGHIRLTQGKGHVMFAVDMNHLSIRDKICEVISRFGINYTVQQPKETDKCFKIRVESKQLATYLSQFKVSNTTIDVPEFIFCGTKAIRQSYICGLLDADGSFKTRPINVASSIYPDYLKQVQELLGGLGIVSNIKLNRPAKNNWKALYTITVKGVRYINKLYDFVKDGCLKFENAHCNSKNSYMYGFNSDMVKSSGFKNLYKNWSAQSKQMTVDTAETVVGQRIKNIPISIMSVDYTNDLVETFDIEVENRHEFIAGAGYLTHNSAEVCLFDKDDEETRYAKQKIFTQDADGNFVTNSGILHRTSSNNSILFESKPSYEELKQIFESIKTTGEPGFISAEAARKRFPDMMGVNPCCEILLPSKGFCNLVEINCMAHVDLSDIRESVELATRASYRMACVDIELPEWDKNMKDNMLLGVSLSGWQDFVNKEKLDEETQISILLYTKTVSHNSMSEYAKELGRNESKLVTTEKPSGTLSLLPTVSPGIHHSHSPYYIRRVRINSGDPLVKVCEELGYKVVPEVGQDIETCTTKVVEFYVKAPEGKTKQNVTAIEQLETYKMFMDNYVDHNASVTVTVKSDEWDGVVDWVYNNWDSFVGISFLALDGGVYELMPYESITKEQYDELIQKYPAKDITPELIAKYEITGISDIGDSECTNGICPIR